MKDVVVVAKALLRLISAGLYAMRCYSLSMRFLIWSLHSSDYKTVTIPMQNVPPAKQASRFVPHKKLAEVVYVDSDAMMKLSTMIVTEIAPVKTHLDIN